jgi:L-ascorbate metabolism protein UlaG (beta-lactamase superfamily)
MQEAIALDPAFTLEFAYAASSGRYVGELDCRLLFLGEHHRDLVPAFEELAGWFVECPTDDEVRQHLASSPAVGRFYEATTTSGPLRVRLRDSIFFEAGPTAALEIELRVRAGKTGVSRQLAGAQLRALGTLLPLLIQPTPLAQVEWDVRHSLPGEEARWALDLLHELHRLRIVSPMRRRVAAPFGGAIPAVTFLGHSSLLVQTESSAVLVDPLLLGRFGQPRAAFDCARIPLDGVFLSHSHWDHCNLQTLVLLDKKTPIHIPALRCASAFNPPIEPMLRLLGFSDIREVRHWEAVRCGDIEVIPTPFFGEADEPGEEIDHFTYVICAAGTAIYGAVDSYRDAFGEMTGVLEEIRDRFRPQLAFLPVSRMTYPYRGGGVNGFCRHFERSLLDSDFQYTADPTLAAQWLGVLQSRWLVPYATFSLGRFSPPAHYNELKREMARSGLSDRLYPMLPLDQVVLPGIAERPSQLRQLGYCNACAAANAVIGAARAARNRLRRQMAETIAH